MKIQYRTKKLQQLCEVKATAEKQLGPQSAKKLRTRLAALEAAARVTDLVAGDPHPLKGDLLGQFSLSLAGGDRFVFSAAHHSCPTFIDGSIDWSQVTMVCVEFIGDYHD